MSEFFPEVEFVEYKLRDDEKPPQLFFEFPPDAIIIITLLFFFTSRARFKVFTSYTDDVDVSNINLEIRENTGKKVPMSEKHGNYVKICVQEQRVKIFWVSTHTADIMTKPFYIEPHEYFRDIIMNNENNSMF